MVLICEHLAEICGKFWLWLRYAVSFVVQQIWVSADPVSGFLWCHLPL